uniref:Uncharacterized protein n=1 Tax=Rhizophora mucronata TaxID=61149 RepID=A0A2P2QWZ5_RHIMU
MLMSTHIQIQLTRKQAQRICSWQSVSNTNFNIGILSYIIMS